MAFALFISLFALDVFNEGRDFAGTALALLMHLLPTLVIVGVLVLSWRREWIGGVVYSFLAVFYVVWFWGKFPLSAYLVIAAPLAVMGASFMLNWFFRTGLRSSPHT